MQRSRQRRIVAALPPFMEPNEVRAVLSERVSNPKAQRQLVGRYARSGKNRR